MTFGRALYLFFVVAIMVFLVAPLFYLIFGLKVFEASLEEFYAFATFHVACSLMMSNFLFGKHRRPFVSDMYELLQAVFTFGALVSVLINPRKPTFKVTAKDESIGVSRLSEISAPFFIIFAVLLVGVGVTVYRVYTEPYNADVTVVVGAWNLLNLVMAGAALGVVSERGARTATRRIKTSRRCDFRQRLERFQLTDGDR